MRSLDVLQRLAKQEVDRERQVLQAISSEIATVEAEIEIRQKAIAQEASAPLDFMTTGATLTAFLQAGEVLIQTLRERLARLQEVYDAQIERVRQERVEQKRYELLIERRAKQAALEAAAKEQKTIDELVTISAKRN
ncbi:MAG: flagellar FliJ family protein [Geminicoccaceae bacterium]